LRFWEQNAVNGRPFYGTVLIFFLSDSLFIFLQYGRIKTKIAILVEDKTSHAREDMPECQ